MTVKTEIVQHLSAEQAGAAVAIPAGVALLLTALFVGITLLIAFWRKNKARRMRRKAKRRHKWQWGYFWAGALFVLFGGYILFLGFDDR